MRVETYTTRSQQTRFRPVLESLSDVEGGMCIACGQEADCCEPDARQYHCEGCGVPLVYGIEELVMMGIAKVEFE